MTAPGADARPPTGDGDAVAIGCFGGIGRQWLGDRLLALAQVYPAVDPGIHDMSRGELLTAVRDRRLTVAIMPGEPAPGLRSSGVWVDRVALAMPAGHRLAALSAVPVDALAGERLLVPRQTPGRELYDFLRQRIAPGRQVETVLCEGGLQRQLDHVAAGFGVAMRCESQGRARDGQVVLRPIAAPTATFPIRAYWRDPAPPALSVLLGTLHAETEIAETPNHP